MKKIIIIIILVLTISFGVFFIIKNQKKETVDMPESTINYDNSERINSSEEEYIKKRIKEVIETHSEINDIEDDRKKIFYIVDILKKEDNMNFETQIIRHLVEEEIKSK